MHVQVKHKTVKTKNHKYILKRFPGWEKWYLKIWGMLLYLLSDIIDARY